MTVQHVQKRIGHFKGRFKVLKTSTRENLERCKIPLKSVADALTSQPADNSDEHEPFLN